MSRLALCLLLVGCGGGSSPNPDDRVSITTGVYGETTSYDDTTAETEPLSTTLIVFEGTDGPELAQVSSDGDGFYQRELAAGMYRICTSFGSCAPPFIVAAGARVRCDFEAGPGGGIWQCR